VTCFQIARREFRRNGPPLAVQDQAGALSSCFAGAHTLMHAVYARCPTGSKTWTRIRAPRAGGTKAARSHQALSLLAQAQRFYTTQDGRRR